jgi:hypothetical protein
MEDEGQDGGGGYGKINNICLNMGTQNLTNSVALVNDRTIPTERPPLVGEVTANF